MQNTSKKYTDCGNMSNDGRNMSLFTRIRDLRAGKGLCVRKWTKDLRSGKKKPTME